MEGSLAGCAPYCCCLPTYSSTPRTGTVPSPTAPFPAEFTYPSSWLGDQTLLYRAAQRAEAERGGLPGDPFDYYPPASSSGSRAAGGRRSSRSSVVEPVAAFGPAGTT